MTDKSKRQRGSRTHGGGTHKNRRGAGNRGGRGRAGRDKHEFHDYEELGKHGFKRPQSTDREIAEISIRKLDEDAVLYAAEGLAEETDDGYTIDARDVVEDGHEVDAVKVLADGEVRQPLAVTADEFSDAAAEALREAGGEAIALADEPEASSENDAENE